MAAETPILEIRGIKKYFPVREGLLGRQTKTVKAVDDVNLQVYPGETLGIVGESGCGKSTLARVIMRLIEPTEGEILFNGKSMTAASGTELKNMRRDIQIVFQDPYASLNPRQKIGSMLKEPYEIHHLASGAQAQKEAEKLLELVGLPPESMEKYPHEFSGGQRQRLCIARALAVRPKILVCDECVSALDVSIQAQIINLLTRLQRELGIALIFISHDLRVVRHISSRVAVMYLGHVVEYAQTEELFRHPGHPYTQALLSAVPPSDPDERTGRIVLEGEIPSPIDMPEGCPFHTRCFRGQELCRTECPKLRRISETGHLCSCHFAE